MASRGARSPDQVQFVCARHERAEMRRTVQRSLPLPMMMLMADADFRIATEHFRRDREMPASSEANIAR